MSFAPLVGSLLGDGDAPSESSRIGGRLEGEHVLVPLLTAEVPAVTDQIKVATTLARTTGASLSVTSPVAMPEGTPERHRRDVDGGTDDELLDWALDRLDGASAGPDGLFGAHHLANGVLDTISANDVDTVVLPGHSSSGVLRQDSARRIAVHAGCDTVVVNGRAGYEEVPSILLPIAGGPHSGLAADLARCIAADSDAWIDVLHVVEEDADDRRRAAAQSCVEAAADRIARPETTTTWVLEADDAAETIIKQSGYYDLTVVGAPTKGRLRQFVRGSTTQSIRADARSVVLSARNNTCERGLDDAEE